MAYKPSGSISINPNGYVPSGSINNTSGWTSSGLGAGIGAGLSSILNRQERTFDTQVRVNGKIYTAGIDSAGNYYLSDGKSSAIIRDDDLINTLKQNKPVTVNYGGSINNAVVTSTPPKNTAQQPTQTQPTTTNKTSGGSDGGSTPKTPSIDLSAYDKKIDALMAEIEELKKPKVYTAQELADRYGLSDQYNEQYWLDKYNEATNNYYNDAVSEQQKLRSDYLVNNYDYTNELVNNYLNSYQNAAPTASGKAAIAANALATQQNANYINSSNDYGMLQSINDYEEARKAELENNPWLAKQAYNNLGVTLMQLGADHNAADVKKYVGDLDAYANYYDAYRTSQAANASASAAKYAGLASAAATNAGTASSSYGNRLYEQLFNQFSNYGNKANTAYLNSIGYGK